MTPSLRWKALHISSAGNPQSYAITLRGKSRLSPALPSRVSPDQIGIKRRLHFAGRTPCRAVECVDLLLDRAAGLGHRRPFNPLRRYRRALLGRIRRNQARMDGKSFNADKILLNAAAYRRTEQLAWHITSGNGDAGFWRMSHDPAHRLPGQAGRTTDRRGSNAPPHTAGASRDIEAEPTISIDISSGPIQGHPISADVQDPLDRPHIA